MGVPEPRRVPTSRKQQLLHSLIGMRVRGARAAVKPHSMRGTFSASPILSHPQTPSQHLCYHYQFSRTCRRRASASVALSPSFWREYPRAGRCAVSAEPPASRARARVQTPEPTAQATRGPHRRAVDGGAVGSPTARATHERPATVSHSGGASLVDQSRSPLRASEHILILIQFDYFLLCSLLTRNKK